MSSGEPRIDVALATWNGATWLAEQLASLAAQTLTAHVMVGDDGSSDGTLAVVEAWRERMPGGMTILPQVEHRLGATGNFSRVLSASTADWVACCDQDDVWDRDHLAALLRAVGSMDAAVPTLVVGDMRVVDQDLRLLHSSFWRLQCFDARRGRELSTLAVMNCFPGCAMLANRALLQAALPIPVEASNHDWWLALTAAALGRIVVLEQSIGQYRQHAGNSIGATAFLPLRSTVRSFSHASSVAIGVQRAARQAAALLQRHGDRIDASRQRALREAASLHEARWWYRRWHLWTGTLRRHPWQRQLNVLLRG